jgi:hypothetical protein
MMEIPIGFSFKVCSKNNQKAENQKLKAEFQSTPGNP